MNILSSFIIKFFLTEFITITRQALEKEEEDRFSFSHMNLNQSEGCAIMSDRDNLIDLAPVASYYDASRATNFKLLLVVLGGKV